eukprot:TRINITY_DN46375_c0_g2_i2.p1 TRINITY_DN46375_c0_g2~~TRINITY_DN46375_c0_g2_i2.p1  ORF type:complete len:420 (-),score=82.64 TRINITY_DN46375_c0_g2_i2:16-1275(-)
MRYKTVRCWMSWSFFFFQAEDGIRDAQESRGLGDVYKRQAEYGETSAPRMLCSAKDDVQLSASPEETISGYVSRRAMYYFKSSGWSRCWAVLLGKKLLFFADRGMEVPLDELQIEDNTRISPSPPAHEDEEEPAPSPFQFLVQSNGMGWLVCVESLESKQEWLHAVAIARRPRWMPDRSASACTKCKAGFSLTRRRHHCRSCGELFCTRCAPPMLSRSIPQLSYNEAVRTCLDCIVKWNAHEHALHALPAPSEAIPLRHGDHASGRGSFTHFSASDTWMNSSFSHSITQGPCLDFGNSPQPPGMMAIQHTPQGYSDEDIKVVLATNARLKEQVEELQSSVQSKSRVIADRDKELAEQDRELTALQHASETVSYTHLRAHETPEHLVCRLLLEKKKKTNSSNNAQFYTSLTKLCIIIVII